MTINDRFMRDHPGLRLWLAEGGHFKSTERYLGDDGVTRPDGFLRWKVDVLHALVAAHNTCVRLRDIRKQLLDIRLTGAELLHMIGAGQSLVKVLGHKLLEKEIDEHVR